MIHKTQKFKKGQAVITKYGNQSHIGVYVKNVGDKYNYRHKILLHSLTEGVKGKTVHKVLRKPVIIFTNDVLPVPVNEWVEYATNNQ